MQEVESRISELEELYAKSKRAGIHQAESWLYAELIAMRSCLRQMKRASVPAEALR